MPFFGTKRSVAKCTDKNDEKCRELRIPFIVLIHYSEIENVKIQLFIAHAQLFGGLLHLFHTIIIIIPIKNVWIVLNAFFRSANLIIICKCVFGKNRNWKSHILNIRDVWHSQPTKKTTQEDTCSDWYNKLIDFQVNAKFPFTCSTD